MGGRRGWGSTDGSLEEAFFQPGTSDLHWQDVEDIGGAEPGEQSAALGPWQEEKAGLGWPAGYHQQQFEQGGVRLRMLPGDDVVVWVLRPPASPSLGSRVWAPQVCGG
ncbi:hypothetical protein NDU88_010556 [Pleurodeles waltl]|uniref:Uncharacterized protein n=1 Tax=Pleurodeles waltl TaxID=8319 RepID=A0AAV7RYK3_PLEWA|nr:hypothetical protein NDU88_010556 [Pleurodeles waltl]